MKALILAAGRGKRLGDAVVEHNKCMLEIKGKPLIEYSLDCAANLGIISEIIIVVGYKAEEIINKYGNRYKDKTIKYVIQENRQGLVHAIECAKEALEKEEFMLLLADELLHNPKHELMISKYKEENLFGICGVVAVEDKTLVSKTYSIIQDSDNRIYRLIEKPARPMNNIMGTGNCIFKNEILDYIPHTPINQKRKEKELPDLIQCAVDDGHIIKSFLICDYYINVNSKEELKEARSYFAHL
jgi:dTDP-glucose pyrophosphorylase